jgi:hypothetical protein
VAVAKERLFDVLSSVRDWRIVRAVVSKISGVSDVSKSTIDKDEMTEVRSPLVGSNPDVAAVSNAIVYVFNTFFFQSNVSHFL